MRPILRFPNTAVLASLLLTLAFLPDLSPSAAAVGTVDIAATGDIACDPDVQGCTPTTEVTKQIIELFDGDAGDPFSAKLLTLGDDQYLTGLLDDYQTSFDISVTQTLGGLGQIKPSPGNHDHNQTTGKSYLEPRYCTYFFGGNGTDCNGNFTADPANPNEAWYSTKVGSAPGAGQRIADVQFLVISLDSETGTATTRHNQQTSFITSALAADTTHTCEIVIWHHPLFTSGANHDHNDVYKDWYREFDQGAGDIVLVGHNHQYERFAQQDRNGTAGPIHAREFVSGAGGAGLYPFQSGCDTRTGTDTGCDSNSQFRYLTPGSVNATDFGILRIQLDPGVVGTAGDESYNWFYYDKDNVVVDQGSTKCDV